MLRFLVLFLLVWLTLRLIETGIRRLAQASSPEPPEVTERRASQSSAVRLVRCQQCGVRVPENRARRLGNGFVCLPDCRRRPDEGHGVGASGVEREAS